MTTYGLQAVWLKKTDLCGNTYLFCYRINTVSVSERNDEITIEATPLSILEEALLFGMIIQLWVFRKSLPPFPNLFVTYNG